MAEYQVQSKQDHVNVRIASNINSFASERRYQKSISILELKVCI